MTRKDYIKAAEIARWQFSHGEAKVFIGIREAFVELFRGDNPRFDVERFRAACEEKG